MAVLSRPAVPRQSGLALVSVSAAASSASSLGHAFWLILVLSTGLIFLETGCRWALNNLAQIAALARIDQTLVSLLTAGGEWEELAVVIAAVKQGRSALAIGNVIGSAISNILGAFSLGLLFAPSPPTGSNEENPSALPAGFRYAGTDPDTGLAIVRVESRPRTGFHFDRSARTYATAQFLITSVVAPLLYFAQATAEKYGPIYPVPSRPHESVHSSIGANGEAPRRGYLEWTPNAIRVFAIILFVVFGIYLISIGSAIYRGWIAPPPDTDDEDSASSSSRSSSSDDEAGLAQARRPQQQRGQGVWSRWFWTRHGGPNEQTLVSATPSENYGSIPAAATTAEQQQPDGETETQDGEIETQTHVRAADDSSPFTHWLFRSYPDSRLIVIVPRLLGSLIGFALLALSGSLLASSGAGLAALFGWSDTLFGLTLLSFLTTLPEKGLSVMAGRKGLHGALAGAAAGSNTFLLTLCAGVALLGVADERAASYTGLSSNGSQPQAPLIKWQEILLLWLSSLALWTICLAGGRRWHGVVLLAAYVAYLVVELTVWRR
ncbi:unnamed protein product [Tilletia laevis]|uniref:Sodium/calcium exchanger membrane region domain-containing protein n=2 Tax=Tilletia TaxID=13289 RepID=A0A177VA11_9BASI|nr:hypothetical protein CF336_g5743 [Tilletia laevis]KAE8256909.1 hypothetical protein A4X03_0g4937 [Tilletia caries]KAE8196310.1 hypothetical protein CF335_g4888 [Tilletia laevis]CAD6884501.1 unnamed protein product [Tilletia caries]CAD6917460.1 unnamed protein product [Tilletia caries]